jgi:hypothetical protein
LIFVAVVKTVTSAAGCRPCGVVGRSYA